MNVRPIELRDVEGIQAIQSASPELAQWSAAEYARIAQGEMAGWVAEDEAGVAGFLVARQVATDFEILNFAVRPEVRRHGIGAALLRHSLAWSKTFHAERAFLEVRVSNVTALRFYEHHGFRVTGRRPHYYTAPPEDAFVLTCTLE